MSVIAILVGAIGFAFVRSGAETTGLQTAQTTLVGLLNLARSEAAITGEDVALLVNVDPNNSDRYLRFAVVVRWNDAATPKAGDPVNAGVTLPPGLYFVPKGEKSEDVRYLDGGFKESGVDWYRCGSAGTPIRSAGDIDSGALGEKVTEPILGGLAGEKWIGLVFSPRGTTSAGDLAVCLGKPDSAAAGFPVKLTNPDNVRGIAISQYGQIRLLNSRQDF